MCYNKGFNLIRLGSWFIQDSKQTFYLTLINFLFFTFLYNRISGSVLRLNNLLIQVTTDRTLTKLTYILCVT